MNLHLSCHISACPPTPQYRMRCDNRLICSVHRPILYRRRYAPNRLSHWPTPSLPTSQREGPLHRARTSPQVEGPRSPIPPPPLSPALEVENTARRDFIPSLFAQRLDDVTAALIAACQAMSDLHLVSVLVRGSAPQGTTVDQVSDLDLIVYLSLAKTTSLSVSFAERALHAAVDEALPTLARTYPRLDLTLHVLPHTHPVYPAISVLSPPIGAGPVRLDPKIPESEWQLTSVTLSRHLPQAFLVAAQAVTWFGVDVPRYLPPTSRSLRRLPAWSTVRDDIEMALSFASECILAGRKREVEEALRWGVARGIRGAATALAVQVADAKGDLAASAVTGLRWSRDLYWSATCAVAAVVALDPTGTRAMALEETLTTLLVALAQVGGRKIQSQDKIDYEGEIKFFGRILFDEELLQVLRVVRDALRDLDSLVWPSATLDHAASPPSPPLPPPTRTTPLPSNFPPSLFEHLPAAAYVSLPYSRTHRIAQACFRLQSLSPGAKKRRAWEDALVSGPTLLPHDLFLAHTTPILSYDLEQLTKLSSAGAGPLWDPLDAGDVGTPVVIRGAASHWPATTRAWSWARLEAAAGDSLVRARLSPTLAFTFVDPRYQVQYVAGGKSHLAPSSEAILTLTEVMARMRVASDGYLAWRPWICPAVYKKDEYIYAQTPLPSNLVGDVDPVGTAGEKVSRAIMGCEMRDSSSKPFVSVSQAPRLWLSTPGSVSTLHYDANPSVLFQVQGRKRMLFWPPRELRRLRPYPHRHPLRRRCQLGVESALLQWEGTKPVHAVLEPGDAIVFPGYWAHYTESLDASISLTCRFSSNGATCPPSLPSHVT